MLCYHIRMETRPWEIYVLVDPRTDGVRYVGVTFRGKARFREHLSRAVTGGQTHRDCWIRSLISIGERPVYRTIERGQGAGWQDAERAWIARYRESVDLVNHTDGGDGTPGCIPSPELRRKWSEMRSGVPYPPGRVSAMLGMHHTPEARAKISAAVKGRKASTETRAKLSRAAKKRGISPEAIKRSIEVRRGIPLSQEHRQKIAAATTGRKPVVCIETGQAFASITEVARFLDVNEASVYQAIRKGCRCKGNHYRLA